MHILSRKALRLFWDRHPESENPQLRWYRIMQRTDFHGFEELRAAFPTADKVDHWIVFNMGGNKYRLITSVHFNRNKVCIRRVLTHQEYDRETW